MPCTIFLYHRQFHLDAAISSLQGLFITRLLKKVQEYKEKIRKLDAARCCFYMARESPVHCISPPLFLQSPFQEETPFIALGLDLPDKFPEHAYRDKFSGHGMDMDLSGTLIRFTCQNEIVPAFESPGEHVQKGLLERFLLQPPVFFWQCHAGGWESAGDKGYAGYCRSSPEHFSEQEVRGMGFEPKNSYETRPST